MVHYLVTYLSLLRTCLNTESLPSVVPVPENELVMAGFHEDPKDKVGALFWGSHRCARIIFSLKYEMGEMTAAVRWLAIIAVIDPSTLHFAHFR